MERNHALAPIAPTATPVSQETATEERTTQDAVATATAGAAETTATEDAVERPTGLGAEQLIARRERDRKDRNDAKPETVVSPIVAFGFTESGKTDFHAGEWASVASIFAERSETSSLEKTCLHGESSKGRVKRLSACRRGTESGDPGGTGRVAARPIAQKDKSAHPTMGACSFPSVYFCFYRNQNVDQLPDPVPAVARRRRSSSA